MRKIMISGVQSGSIAQELGIESGDFLVSINESSINDVFDYRFFCADSVITLEIEKKNGDRWKFDIEKDEMEDLGLDFENSLMDEEKSCRNKCMFCFIDQLPKGMRDTLYFKDDDARLSFLFGNYITLTNISDDEIDRIIRYRMSPVNISIQATNPSLRRRMLKNRFAGDILDKIKRFTTNGITVNGQIVLCPGINDGDELDRTLCDITCLYPELHSVSIVPVGLTRFREGLAPLKPFDMNKAIEIVNQVETWQNKLLKEYGSRIVYLADEIYIKAGKSIPSNDYYEDFPQIENGVGMVSSLVSEIDDALLDIRGREINLYKKQISIATGVSVYPYIREIADQIEKSISDLKINVFPVENTFFGLGVTVTGLLTGYDIIRELSDKDLGDRLLLCRNMFRAGTTTLLDDNTKEGLEEKLGVEILIIDTTGQALMDAIIQG